MCVEQVILLHAEGYSPCMMLLKEAVVLVFIEK